MRSPLTNPLCVRNSVLEAIGNTPAVKLRKLVTREMADVGCIEVACEIFESAIHRDRGHCPTGSEFTGQLQSSDHIQPRRGPCKDAFLPRQPPSPQLLILNHLQQQ